MRRLTITRPDDWHIHLRDDDYLKSSVADISRHFGRAIVMPNLVPPVRDVKSAASYRDRINSLVPDESSFAPLMTLYLTDRTSPETVVQAKASGFIHAFKLYPAGVTTHSEAGVTAIESLYPLFEAMQEQDMPLSVHGEVSDSDVDIFDREWAFIDRYLIPISESFPALRVIFEHISTRDAVQFVEESGHSIAATITAHHLLYNRNDLLAGGMKPLYYCLPVLKRAQHQQALLQAATSGNPCFFLGTDSAPHPRTAKENACGCAAGSYTAHAAIELYAEVFDQANSLDLLEAFASHYGPDFYQLPRNHDTITLIERPLQVPAEIPFGSESLVPIRAGESIRWSVE